MGCLQRRLLETRPHKAPGSRFWPCCAWRPRHLLVVDIGGGVQGRDGLKLGDVVTHTDLYYYDFYKVDSHGNKSPRYFAQTPASSRLREWSRCPRLRNDSSWIDHIGTGRPARGDPSVREGELLVGGAIQSNSPRLRLLLENYPKALVVEMGAVGAGRAVLDSSLAGALPR